MPPFRRICFTVAIAPLAEFPVSVFVCTFFLRTPGTTLWDGFQTSLFASLVGLALSYLAMIIYGIPVLYLLSKMKHLNFLPSTSAGAIGGLAISMIFHDIKASALLVACGAAVAALAWYLIVSQAKARPNLSFNPDPTVRGC
ncbi:MAG: hypothetical protein IPQ13_04275 [Holophagaceae bacterium]|nr:hypothetical protein [Holophagaceae bacterium]